MRTFDLTPLFRSTVGFDRLNNLANRIDSQANSYPPYNIEKTGEDTYRITMAVAGFAEKDISIVAQANSLTVTGKVERSEEPQTSYLYRGIAGRAFERRFDLADYVVVSGATLDNGLLNIDLVRQVPEALKPRQISIQAGSAPVEIEQKAA